MRFGFLVLLALCCNGESKRYLGLGNFNSKEAPITEVCASKMFGNEVNALRSCMTAYALQYNWYPSPIAGLFSYQTWNGFDGFWQDGTVLETLVNFMQYANNTMYKSVVSGSLRDVYTLLEAYYPQPSYDDMAWYGLSYTRIHEVFGPGNDDPSYGFLYEARQIYDWVWTNGWDTTNACGGGIWFDQTLAGKETVENAQVLLLGSKLHRLSGDESLIPKINQSLQFILSNQIVNTSNYWVADGIKTNCSSNDFYGPTYNMGLMLSALVEAGEALNKTKELIPLVHKIALAAIHNSAKDGVLVEYCAPSCDDDAKMFKGIFMRHLRYLIDYTTSNDDSKQWQENIEIYRKFLQHNSDTAWKMNRCEPSEKKCMVLYKDGKSLHNTTVGPLFGIHYTGPYNCSAPMQQASVLDLFVSSIGSGVKCVGPQCNYDPPIPQPSPLTCQDNPCPPDQPCCTYEEGYYTCCESTQTCKNGECV